VEEAIALAGRMAGLGSEPRVARPPRDETPWLLDLLFGESTARSILGLTRSMAAPTMGAGPLLKYIVR
jgi:hypothetical protein